MSRTPPIVLRISSGTQHFTSCGISRYYYYDQLKLHIALGRSVEVLGQQLYFPSFSQSKLTPATLKPEILPLYTILRAQQSFSKLLLISKQYFNCTALGCAKQLLGLGKLAALKSPSSERIFLAKGIGLQASKLLQSSDQSKSLVCLSSLINAVKEKQKVFSNNRSGSQGLQLSNQRPNSSHLAHATKLFITKGGLTISNNGGSLESLTNKEKHSGLLGQAQPKIIQAVIRSHSIDLLGASGQIKQACLKTTKVALFYLMCLKLLSSLPGGLINLQNKTLSQEKQLSVLPQTLIFSTPSRVTKIQNTLTAKVKNTATMQEEKQLEWCHLSKANFETISAQCLHQKAIKSQYKLDGLYSSAVIKPVPKYFIGTCFKQPTQLHLFLQLGGLLPEKDFKNVAKSNRRSVDFKHLTPIKPVSHKTRFHINNVKSLQRSIFKSYDQTKDLFKSAATAISNLKSALIFKLYESSKSQSPVKAKVSIRL